MRLIWIGLATLCLSSCLSAGCPQGQFACSNGECVNSTLRCDHVSNCADASDELHCDYACKGPHMRPCKDGHCIAMYFFCNGENDCGDWSDELNCTAQVNDEKTPCSANTFRCEGTQHPCIPLTWVCDGMADCADGRDEVNCTTKHECKSGFQCGKECILNQWVCDGTEDCADGSDEKECGPDGYLDHACLPEHGWFSCMSKGTKKCMPLNRVCDGYVDCDDSSDEGGQCGTNCSSVSHCEHNCVKTPTGPICTCPLGLRLNGSSCVDIDECAISPPMCSHSCKNTHGGYQCTCASDYTLDPRNNRTCIANGPDMTLLITTDRDIRSISFPSREYRLVYPGVSEVHGITGYVEDGFIYWNEKNKERAGIFKSMEDGTNHQVVISAGIETIEDVEIDWIGRHVYFTDSGRKHIVACDVYGTPCTVVISGGLEKPRAIALYPEKRLLFWSDWGSRPHIGSAGMDGSRRRDIITSDIAWPNGLAVDETINRIYWSDAKLNRIESARLDGSQRAILPVTVNNPYSIDIFEDTIFWSDRAGHEVQSCNKHSGKNHKILMKESSLSPVGIYVHHPSKQRHMSNPCWNVVCSHLCLLSPDASGSRCACPVGMKLDETNRTCIPAPDQKSSLVIASFTELYQLTHEQIGKDSIARLPTRSLDNIGALAFNPLDYTIVYSDLGKRVIYSMHLETKQESILFENAEGVEGIAVDPYTGNVFWTEVTQGTLVVGHGGERLVLARNLLSPARIVAAPDRGLLFVVEGRLNQSISAWHMDGTSRRDMVHAYGIVTAIAYNKGYLYFCDSVRGTIEKISADGHDRAIMRSHINSPVAMDVSDDAVFWLTQLSTRVNWLNTSETRQTRGFVIDASEDIAQYRLLAAVHQFDFDEGHVCLGHTGGCSDICVATPNGAKCLCPVDKAMTENGHTCQAINCSADETFQCHSKCIPLELRCNGVRDCTLGEDEVGCRNETVTSATCSSEYFQCKNGQCVPLSFVCDGDSDCADGSDEPDTCPPHVCGAKDYSCPKERRCIPLSGRCDGEEDCKDGSDESNCTLTTICDDTQFYCNVTKYCIPQTWVCDKSRDCANGEDEDAAMCSEHALSVKCAPGFIRCQNHLECMPRSAFCRNELDCASKTDEQLCAIELPTEIYIAKKSCSDNEFMCYMGSNDCIPLSDKCNCKFDCRFGEDEEGCPPCEDGQFRCPKDKRYIKQQYVCDGFDDCTDGADENPAMCQPTASPVPSSRFKFQGCSQDEFECLNGQCIPDSLTCDGVAQCTDGTDEGTKCATSCELDNGGCPQMCKSSPNGAICECGPGYESQFDGRVCSDIDECETGQDQCSQYCSNTKGSYKCSCAPGYKLEYDHHTCKLVGGRPMIVVSGPSHVELLFNIRESYGRQLITSDVAIKDIAYNDRLSTLYWVTANGVSRTNTRGTKVVYRMSGLLPSAIALDHATGNIYFSALMNSTSEQDRSMITVLSSSTNADFTIITTRSIITDLAIDGSAGILFWSEHTKPSAGRIIRSAMDGSATNWLHSLNKVEYPVALTLDTVKRRVYWADLRQHSIWSCDYDGTKQKVVVSNTHAEPLSLTFFENRITWTALGHSAIYSQTVSPNGTLLTYPMNGNVMHVIAVHPVLEPALPNPCASSPCNNGLCILKNNASFSCHCAQGGAVLSSNPFKCHESDALGVEEEYDAQEIAGSPGVTIATIIACLAALTMLAVLGCVYYRRWRRSIGSPLKFRFRSALGLAGESTAWEEGIDYSDRKQLYHHEDLDDTPTDHNENRAVQSVRIQSDSAYDQSLTKPRLTSIGSEPHQLLSASYSMKDHLLASEL